ncbi:hypothetical protein QVD17_22976 [Tagetes erecta]|uniref:Uncharacterized protein n=1 Tax=Tagetes erecta TaxID=13708 RepID=A0AAD8KJY9_TARER|nr:hypothetical protein QVD17_22976 [Tagetes erecta]
MCQHIRARTWLFQEQERGCFMRKNVFIGGACYFSSSHNTTTDDLQFKYPNSLSASLSLSYATFSSNYIFFFFFLLLVLQFHNH